MHRRREDEEEEGRGRREGKEVGRRKEGEEDKGRLRREGKERKGEGERVHAAFSFEQNG